MNFNFLRKRYEHAMMSAKQDFSHETEKNCDSAKRWLRVIWEWKTASEDAQRWRKHLKEVLLILDKCIIAISSTKPMQERQGSSATSEPNLASWTRRRHGGSWYFLTASRRFEGSCKAMTPCPRRLEMRGNINRCCLWRVNDKMIDGG